MDHIGLAIIGVAVVWAIALIGYAWENEQGRRRAERGEKKDID
jgi:hypothetical protein